MNRYERYQALKTATLRAGLACLADHVEDRTVERADGLQAAWDRIGRVVFPMDGDFDVRRIQPGDNVVTTVPMAFGKVTIK